MSAASGQKNGQTNRERNSEKANIEYRIMNIEYRMSNVEVMYSVYFKKTERSDSINPKSLRGRFQPAG